MWEEKTDKRFLVCAGGKIPEHGDIPEICSEGPLMLQVKDDGSESGQVPGE